MGIFSYICANKMELQENSVIIDDKLCVTPKYLSEVCKRVSGFSANSWINCYAAINLVHLLKDKSLSLTDISDMYDFSSQSHFSRFVQNNLGQKPSAFRT